MHSLSSVYVHSSFNNLLLCPVDLPSTRMKLACNHIHYTNAACGFDNTTSTCKFKVHRKGAEFSKYLKYKILIFSCQSNQKARGSKYKHSILTGQPRPIQIQGNIQMCDKLYNKYQLQTLQHGNVVVSFAFFIHFHCFSI